MIIQNQLTNSVFIFNQDTTVTVTGISYEQDYVDYRPSINYREYNLSVKHGNILQTGYYFEGKDIEVLSEPLLSDTDEITVITEQQLLNLLNNNILIYLSTEESNHETSYS